MFRSMPEVDDGEPGGHSKAIHVLMAGGGTGGHVFPALAVAAELERRGHRVSWAGRARSMEYKLVTAAGLDFHELPAHPWVGQGLGSKAGAAITLLTSSLRGRALVRTTAADAVLGTGGYVSTPAVLGARLAGRPAFLLEPNARAGAANRLAARWAKAAFVAHETTARDLSCEVEVSGIPVRADFHEIGPLPEGNAHLLILGGSQGAQQLNQLIPTVVARLVAESELPGLTVTHQTGGAHVDSVRAAYRTHGVDIDGAVSVVPFIEEVAAAMTRAHLVVSRAGALATAELAAAGRPAVLVPLLGAGAGHQRLNAERVQESGGAIVPSGHELDAGEFGDAVMGLLRDRSRLLAMSLSARALAQPRAASRIAEAVVRGALGGSALGHVGGVG